MGIDSFMIKKINEYLKEEEDENTSDKKDIYFIYLNNNKDKETQIEKFTSKPIKKNKKMYSRY